MDPRLNPYAPGAGTPPPELAGREGVIEAASIALDRIRNGLVARSLMLVGLRGVGKTVLLNRLHNNAEADGFATVMLEAPERKSLPALLAPALRTAVLKLDRMAKGSELARRAREGSFLPRIGIRGGVVHGCGVWEGLGSVSAGAKGKTLLGPSLGWGFSRPRWRRCGRCGTWPSCETGPLPKASFACWPCEAPGATAS